jgi:hypothetical protein
MRLLLVFFFFALSFLALGLDGRRVNVSAFGCLYDLFKAVTRPDGKGFAPNQSFRHGVEVSCDDIVLLTNDTEDCRDRLHSYMLAVRRGVCVCVCGVCVCVCVLRVLS